MIKGLSLGLDSGAYFLREFVRRLNTEKTLVQKSGYFSRAAAANAEDQALIKQCAQLAVDCALRAIEFTRIKGGKPFDIDQAWFGTLLQHIGQPKGAKCEVAH